jgi:CheY-like chemotaxis protein
VPDAPLAGRFEILLVEDNPGDVRLTRETLKDFEVLNHLSVVGDGVEAMAFLRREGKYVHASRPDLILPDLNLPRKDGREVLTEIGVDEQLKRIPVVIPTTAGAEQDIFNTYEHHANFYIKKSVDLDQFSAVGKSIEEFWFTTVQLPPG